jgi:hypothetical protein
MTQKTFKSLFVETAFIFVDFSILKVCRYVQKNCLFLRSLLMDIRHIKAQNAIFKAKKKHINMIKNCTNHQKLHNYPLQLISMNKKTFLPLRRNRKHPTTLPFNYFLDKHHIFLNMKITENNKLTSAQGIKTKGTRISNKKRFIEEVCNEK